MAINKSHIVKSIQDQNGFSEARAEEIYYTLIEIIKSTLALGEDVLIKGFGKFCVKYKKQRRSRNPSTGEDLILPAHKVVTFKAAGFLRERISGE
jgi:integration host factor subunit alpha